MNLKINKDNIEYAISEIEILKNLLKILPTEKEKQLNKNEKYYNTYKIDASNVVFFKPYKLFGFYGELECIKKYSAGKWIGFVSESVKVFNKVINSLYKDKYLKYKIQKSFLEDVVFDFILDSFDKTIDFEQYLLNQVKKVTLELNVFVPINGISIDDDLLPMEIDKNISIIGITKEYINKIVECPKDKDPKIFLTKLYEKYVGWGIKFAFEEVEEERALEISKINSTKILSVLRLFSVSMNFPHKRNSIFIKSSNPLSYPTLCFNNLKPYKTRSYEKLNYDPIEFKFHQQNIEEFTRFKFLDILKFYLNEDIAEGFIKGSIYHANKSIIANNYYDKIVHLVSSIESLFVKNETEEFANSEKRFEFFCKSFIDEENNAYSYLKYLHSLRNDYLHRGEQRKIKFEKLEKISPLYFQLLTSIFISNKQSLTKDQFLSEIDSKL